MKHKFFLTGILSAALVFGLLLTGCSDVNDPVEQVDKSALVVSIAMAENAKTGVVVNTDAAQVAQGTKWVIENDMTTFDNALISAKGTRDTATTQSVIDDAKNTLTAAITAFNTAKKNGTKTSGFTQAELTSLISVANTAKEGVVTSANGTDVAQDKYWVTQAQLDALNTAITAANTATDANRDTSYLALAQAINTFVTEKQLGTKAEGNTGGSKTITITGVPANTEFGIMLFPSNTTMSDRDAVAMGVGTTGANGSITATLKANTYMPGEDLTTAPNWTDSGSYYVFIGKGGGDHSFDRRTKEKITFTSASTTLAYSDDTWETPNTGGGSKTITITGLPANTEFDILLVPSNTTMSDRDLVAGGQETTTANGSITVTLKARTEGLFTTWPNWTDSGSYYVRVGKGTIDRPGNLDLSFARITKEKVAFTSTSTTVTYSSDTWDDPTHGIDTSAWPRQDREGEDRYYFLKSSDSQILAYNPFGRGDGTGTKRIPDFWRLQSTGAGMFPIGTWISATRDEKLIFTANTLTIESSIFDTRRYNYTIDGNYFVYTVIP